MFNIEDLPDFMGSFVYEPSIHIIFLLNVGKKIKCRVVCFCTLITKFVSYLNEFNMAVEKCGFLQDSNENLEDAGNELMISDEDVVRFQIGEVFAHMHKDDVESKLEEMKEEASQNLKRLEEEKVLVLAQMADLKKILYAKFHDSINLEED